jgi:RNA polymerase sigma-70 factor (ECF subfamily)
MALEMVMSADCGKVEDKGIQSDTLLFDNLYQKYKSPVYGFAFYLTRNSGEAEDLFQETWLRVVKYWREKADLHTFKTWIFTITVNLHRDMLRKQRIRRLFLREKSTTLHQAGKDSFNHPERTPSSRINELGNLEIGRTISLALSRLPRKQRLVFILKEMEGFKQSEIGEILKIPLGTVKSLMYRAVKRLQGDLADYKPKSNS